MVVHESERKQGIIAPGNQAERHQGVGRQYGIWSKYFRDSGEAARQQGISYLT